MEVVTLKKKFTSEDILKGRHKINFGDEGSFTGFILEVEEEGTNRLRVHGMLDDQEVSIEVILEDMLEPGQISGLTPGQLLCLPWRTSFLL
jgi:hypothetical protein